MAGCEEFTFQTDIFGWFSRELASGTKRCNAVQDACANSISGYEISLIFHHGQANFDLRIVIRYYIYNPPSLVDACWAAGAGRNMHIRNMQFHAFAGGWGGLMHVEFWDTSRAMAEIRFEAQKWDADKMVVKLSDKVIGAIEEAKKSPTSALPLQAAPDVVPAALNGPKLYTYSDFIPTKPGIKNLKGFLMQLPSRYTKAGMEWSDEIKCPGKTHRWNEIIARSPDMFDVLNANNSSAKQRGISVLRKFLQLQAA